MAMDSLSGEIKKFTLKEYMQSQKTGMPPEKGFDWMPQVGDVVRLEGTKFCFLIKRIDPKKLILKPVSSSEYNGKDLDRIEELEAYIKELVEIFQDFAGFSPHCCEDCPCDYFREKSVQVLQKVKGKQ